MSEDVVGFAEVQKKIEDWSRDYEITEWIHAYDLSGRDAHRLAALAEEGLVWHLSATNEAGYVLEAEFDWFGPCHVCNELDHLKLHCKGSKGGGMQSVGFFVGKRPGNFASLEIDYDLNCAKCNSSGDFDSLDSSCSSCYGQGYVSVDYNWPAGAI